MRTPAISGRTRTDLAAGLATAVVVGQLVLARATFVIAVVLIAIGRGSRWRPHWLLLPMLAGFCWLFAIDAALPRSRAQWLDLAGQLPLALLFGSAQAALVLWLIWWRHRPAWRPGLVALVRRWLGARTLHAGQTVTAGGFALGVVTGTGKLAAVTWHEAERGVLLTGQDGRRLSELGMAATCAALRLRKAVLILDLAGVATAAVGLATSLGVPVDQSAAELGRAIRRRTAVVAGLGVNELVGVLDRLREHDLRADCLAWVSGAELLEPACLDRLLELGPATGTTLLFSSTSQAWAAVAAPKVQVVAAEGPVQAGAANLSGQRSGEFTVIGVARPAVLRNCLLMPVKS